MLQLVNAISSVIVLQLPPQCVPTYGQFYRFLCIFNPCQFNATASQRHQFSFSFTAPSSVCEYGQFYRFLCIVNPSQLNATPSQWHQFSFSFTAAS
jgi:hypothetical protein